MDNAERLSADIRVLTALIEAAPVDSPNDLILKVCVEMLGERKHRLQQIQRGSGRRGRSLTSEPPTEAPSDAGATRRRPARLE